MRAIAPFTFKDCKRLRKVVCGRELNRVYAWAFHGCERLKAFIHGPKAQIDPRAFESKALNT